METIKFLHRLKENKNFYPILVGGVFILALWLRLWGINFGLPYIYTTEEYKVVNYALKMGATKDLNPHFFNYPSLYLYFTLFVSGIYFIIGRIFGIFTSAEDFAYSLIQNPTGIYLILRIFSAIWSTGAVLMTYLIGKEIYSKRVGLLTMIMMALQPAMVYHAHDIRPSHPSLFFVLLSFYFLLRFYKTGEYKFFYLSAGISGIAISIFYNALPMILLLPIAYFIVMFDPPRLCRGKSNHYKIISLINPAPLSRAGRGQTTTRFSGKLWFAILLVPFFFLIGTPFALLDYKTFFRDFTAHSSGALNNITKGLPAVLRHFLFIGHHEQQIIQKTPFLGILGFAGIFLILYDFWKKKKENILVLSALVFLSLPVALYVVPGMGYLFPAISFFLIAGARFIDWSMEKKYKLLPGIVFFACLIPSITECIRIDYSYSLKDTRTIAKEWIEENIPFGSKVLIDMYAKSPPIKMTKAQLEKLYKRAVELNHYKKEYLKLQYEVHPGENYGYEIYQIQRPPEEVSGTIEMVKEAQKAQDLIDVGKGFDYLRGMGIQYIITNSFDEEGALRSDNPVLLNFYENLPKESRMIKVFSPKSKFHPGPVIKVRKLQ